MTDALALTQRSLTAMIAPVARAYRKHIDKAFTGLGLSHSLALPVMLLGRLGDGVRQNALAEELGVEPPSLVPLLDQLERAGLVERHPCLEDKRAKTLRLTPAGHDLAHRAEALAQAVRAALLKDVPPGEVAIAARVLERFHAAIRAAEA
jgi:MarR family transcriptional regulator for hemolysin